MRILHAADLHLDSSFSGLSVEKAAVRRQELREVPKRLAELARTERADLVLLPGDLFDGDRVYPETVRTLANALGEMQVPAFIAPGNHDYYHAGSPYRQKIWPPNVHIFMTAAMESVELPKLNAVVHGCAFLAPHREDDPLAGYHIRPDGKMHILCVHGDPGGVGRYAPIAIESLAQSGAAYGALGHIHTAGGGRDDETFWAWPGCPEGRGFDETGVKGVLVAELSWEDGKVQSSGRLVPICQRRYRVQKLDISKIEEFVKNPGDTKDLVRLVLTGTTDAAPNVNGIGARLAPHFFYLEVKDETTLTTGLWDRAGEETLTGMFLREMRTRLNKAATDEERDQLKLALRFGLAALEQGEDIRP